jgi:hypothetical protein
MKKYTKKFLISEHRRIWGQLAETGGDKKESVEGALLCILLGR